MTLEGFEPKPHRSMRYYYLTQPRYPPKYFKLSQTMYLWIEQRRNYKRFCDVFDHIASSSKPVSIFQIPDYRNAVIVAKTPASARKAQSYAERLRLGIAVIHGEPQDFESDREDGRHSPPPQERDERSLSRGDGFSHEIEWNEPRSGLSDLFYVSLAVHRSFCLIVSRCVIGHDSPKAF